MCKLIRAVTAELVVAFPVVDGLKADIGRDMAFVLAVEAWES
jgi:hypothetical protein